MKIFRVTFELDICMLLRLDEGDCMVDVMKRDNYVY